MLPSSYQIMLFLLAKVNSALFLNLLSSFSSHPKKFIASSGLSHVFLTGSILPTIRVAISSSFCLMLIADAGESNPARFVPATITGLGIHFCAAYPHGREALK